jgi:hypothetical protein
MSVLKNGVWSQELADSMHQSSVNLGAFLVEFLPKEFPVYDFGCGNGYYLSVLEKAGFNCLGFEGIQLNNFLCSTVRVHDLTTPVVLNEKGSVLSLEVGEHLDKSAQATYMKTITDNCRSHLVMSWAELGQPGIGHVNCRNQDAVIRDVERRGFNYLPGLTLKVRKTIEDNASWFQRTLLIFER